MAARPSEGKAIPRLAWMTPIGQVFGRGVMNGHHAAAANRATRLPRIVRISYRPRNPALLRNAQPPRYFDAGEVPLRRRGLRMRPVPMLLGELVHLPAALP